MTNTATVIPIKPVELPSPLERKAHLLSSRQRLRDAEIGRLLGLERPGGKPYSREHVNRLRSAFRAKADALRLQFPDCACSLLAALTHVN